MRCLIPIQSNPTQTRKPNCPLPMHTPKETANRKYPTQTQEQQSPAHRTLSSSSHTSKTKPKNHPPLSPNSLAQSSNSFNPCLLTLGRMLVRLARKSCIPMGLMSSGDMCRSFSPSDLRGPMAASFARAVMSEPEKPVLLTLVLAKDYLGGKEGGGEV